MRNRYLLTGLLALCTVGVQGCNWLGRAADVVSDQVDPYELQRKYEYFKDVSAQLDKKLADLSVYRTRLAKMHCDTAVDRVHIEQCGVWTQEQAGIAASYNALAADYNAQMSKWNYRFCNVGTLPAGATTPLPREFKPYVTE